MFSLLFVIIGVSLPFILPVEPSEAVMSLMERAKQANMQEFQDTWEEGMSVISAVVIVGLYLVMLVVCATSLDYISTSFMHLISPFVFSFISYYRLFFYYQDSSVDLPFFTGSKAEIFITPAVILIITAILAKIRMARHNIRFRNVKWGLEHPARFDRTFLSELAMTFRPLIYPPRLFKVNPDGILIVGWFYLMPIPFRIIRSVTAVNKVQLITSGYCLATFTSNMIRIQLTEQSDSIYISPRDREEFLAYCEEHVAKKKTPGTAGTHADEQPAN